MLASIINSQGTANQVSLLESLSFGDRASVNRLLTTDYSPISYVMAGSLILIRFFMWLMGLGVI
jgi:hypothetical protein